MGNSSSSSFLKCEEKMNLKIMETFKELSDGKEIITFNQFHVLSNLRQYRLLASVYDRLMEFANDDRYMWFQYSLLLICDNRFTQASKILNYCLSLGESEEAKMYDENLIIELMLATQLQLEQHNNLNLALKLATKCVVMSKDTWLAGRCMLIYAISLSSRAQVEKNLEVKKSTMIKAIKQYEKTLELDLFDSTAYFYCALEYAFGKFR